MSADPNKKSARTIQCRDVLWETFEQMARELECSVDYLVNEAMKHYARQRSQGAPRTPYPGLPAQLAGDGSQPSTGIPPLAGAGSAPAVAGSRPAIRQTASGALPPPPSRLPSPPQAPRSAMPIPLPPPRTGAMQVPPPLTGPQAPSLTGPAHAGPPPLAPAPLAPQATRTSAPLPSPPVARSVTAPTPAGGSRSVAPPGGSPRTLPAPAQHGGMPRPAAPVQAAAHSNGFPAPQGATLTLVYNGERHPITKDRFVIGRGKQSSDLTLKDPNVSRQHALVEFQNGVYFMVDMGSTNGVSYNGERLARKPIAEGDVFRICDHDLAFTFR